MAKNLIEAKGPNMMTYPMQQKSLKETIGQMIDHTSCQMADCGYFEGYLKTMWAGLALEAVTDKQAASVYWNMRNRIGWEAN